MLVTQGAIEAIQKEFEKDINYQIQIRTNSTHKYDAKLFNEICIYEDSMRIMRKVLNRVYYQS